MKRIWDFVAELVRAEKRRQKIQPFIHSENRYKTLKYRVIKAVKGGKTPLKSGKQEDEGDVQRRAASVADPDPPGSVLKWPPWILIRI